MEIYFTVTREYRVDIDSDDDAALRSLDSILQRHGCDGENLAERVGYLARFDPFDVMETLISQGLADLQVESGCVDSHDTDDLYGGWAGDDPDDDDDDDDDGEPVPYRPEPLVGTMVLPTFVTGEGFVPSRLT